MRTWAGQQLHISWLLAALAFATMVGIAISPAIHGALFALWQWLLAAGLLVAVAAMKRTHAMLLAVILAGLFIGVWRGSTEHIDLARYALFYGQTVTMYGTVSDDTSYGPNGDQRITLKNIHIGSQPLPGQIWINTSTSATIQRSDSVTVRGKLSSGFGSIAASMFRGTIISVQRPSPGDVGLHIRDWFAGGIRTAIPEPEASLASGYLVGQRSALPEDLDNQLKTVGLTHAVVASGYNLTILVSFARQLLAGTSKYLATFAGAGMIAGFMMMSGLSPSMSRAGLVTSLSLAAWYYGRRIHPFVLLPFAAGITALINPAYIWGDIGWYLSFTSFAGVIVLAPLIQRFLWGTHTRIGFMKQTFVDTMSAQIATLPIMIVAFGQYSPYALVANILVLPLIPLTMLLTFVAGTIGLAFPPIAHLFGLPATSILHYMTTAVSWIANLPGAQGTVGAGASVIIGAYTCLVIMTWWLWHRTRYDFLSIETEQEANLNST